MKKRLVYLNLVIPLAAYLIPFKGHAASVIALVIVIPAILVVLNAALYITKSEPSWFKCCVLMLGGLVMAQAFGFLGWSLSTGRSLTPDAETVAISLSLAKYYAGFASIVFVMGWSVLTIIYRRRGAANKP